MNQQDYQNAVGPCPRCGMVPTKFNNIPLTAYCWGPEDNPHPEMTRIIPAPVQPYGAGRRQTVWKEAPEHDPYP